MRSARCKKTLKSCRSRQELSNEYLIAKIGVGTAENEPVKVHVIFELWDLIFTEPPRPMPLATAVAETCVLMWLSISSETEPALSLWIPIFFVLVYRYLDMIQCHWNTLL